METLRSLASGASAQLVVDAPRLVPLGAHDVQTARRLHLGPVRLGGVTGGLGLLHELRRDPRQERGEVGGLPVPEQQARRPLALGEW